MSEPVKAGDTITVHYTGKLENGEVFDSSEGREPLKFTVGAGQLIQGFDSAVVGMLPGDKKTVTIAPEQGYGPHMTERIFEMPKENVPEDMELEVGMRVQLSDKDKNPVPALIIALEDEIIKLDLNHPLSGKTLTFDIEIHETGLEPDTPGDTAKNCGDCSCEG
jgi:peptidylprolyl isomerase